MRSLKECLLEYIEEQSEQAKKAMRAARRARAAIPASGTRDDVRMRDMYGCFHSSAASRYVALLQVKEQIERHDDN